jgi:hypothetical protein
MKVKEAKINKIKEEIQVPIYFYQKDNGTIVIDVEGITDEFNNKLDEVVKNPKKFLEVDVSNKVLCDTCHEWVKETEYNKNAGLCNRCVKNIQ